MILASENILETLVGWLENGSCIDPRFVAICLIAVALVGVPLLKVVYRFHISYICEQERMRVMEEMLGKGAVMPIVQFPRNAFWMLSLGLGGVVLLILVAILLLRN